MAAEISKLYDQNENAKALIIFAHGAGADKSSEFISDFTKKLTQINCDVLRFNFPYMDKRLLDGKRYPPNRMPQLLSCLTQVLTETSKELPIFLLGKSMGGRVAATLAENSELAVNGVICLGYPFHPQKQPEKLRLIPLQTTSKPVLVIQGERDALGNKDEIASYQLSKLCRVNFLADGDHDLKPRVKSGHTHQQHLASAINMIASFIDENS